MPTYLYEQCRKTEAKLKLVGALMSNQVRYLNVKGIGCGAVFNWRASQYTARVFFGKLSPGQCSCSKIEAKRKK